ncbi:MAG: SDR family oxidoreductase [Rhodospirillales bacterium]|nr:SDR family oxidoreductase [Rhodospirillales bacterium]
MTISSGSALVTGASSGIGAATVRRLAGAGYKLLAVARREDKLTALSEETGCRILAADVRDLDRLGPEIERFAPDILVNNAGVGHGITGIADLDTTVLQEAFDINVVAPIQITALALPGMKARGRGHIVNLGSISGLHTLVSAVYGSAKSAVHRFSQNLRFELGGTGIRVTEICPGRVASEFYSAASGAKEKLAAMGASGITELRPEDIADAILYAIGTPSHVNVATIEILPTEQAVGGVAAVPRRQPD